MTMTTRKTYVKFHELAKAAPTDHPRVEVRTLRGDLLGGIAWYRTWKQFVFIPEEWTVYSYDCLEDIAAKVKALNEVQT